MSLCPVCFVVFVPFVVEIVFVFSVACLSTGRRRLRSRAASGRIGNSSPTIINACVG
jgi:hypothetical protein